MSIETRVPTEEINIGDLAKDFNIGEPNPYKVDVRDFFSEEDLEKAMRYCVGGAKSFKNLQNGMTDIAWLFPEKIAEFPQNMTVFKNTLHTLAREKDKEGEGYKDWRHYTRLASELVLQYPRFRSSVAQSDETWQGADSLLQDERRVMSKGYNMWIAIDHAINSKILYPEKTKNMNFTEAEIELMIDELKEKRQFIKESPDQGSWSHLLEETGYIKVLCPKLRPADLISPEDFKTAQEEIKKQVAEGKYISALSGLKGLKLITAEKVIFSDTGVEIIDKSPEGFKTTGVPVPEIKKF